MALNTLLAFSLQCRIQVMVGPFLGRSLIKNMSSIVSADLNEHNIYVPDRGMMLGNVFIRYSVVNKKNDWHEVTDK